jgi:hypothetical protein
MVLNASYVCLMHSPFVVVELLQSSQTFPPGEGFQSKIGFDFILLRNPNQSGILIGIQTLYEIEFILHTR